MVSDNKTKYIRKYAKYVVQTWQEGSPWEVAGTVWLTRTGVFRALNSPREPEGDLDTTGSTLVARQLVGEEPVADGPRGRHGARLDSVDLLASWALEELSGRAVDELLETGSVVGVAALGESQRAPVLVCQTDVALLTVSITTTTSTSPGHSVGADQVTSSSCKTGSSCCGLLGRSRGG